MTACDLKSTQSVVYLQAAQQYMQLRREQKSISAKLHEAWTLFHQAVDDLVNGIVSRIIRGTIDIEDCCQQVWLEILRCLPQFRYDAARGAPGSWLALLIYRAAYRYRSHLSRAKAEPLPDCTRMPLHVRDTPGERLAIREVQGAMEKHLSETSYQIARMRFVEERNYEEIAIRVKITPDQGPSASLQSKAEIASRHSGEVEVIRARVFATSPPRSVLVRRIRRGGPRRDFPTPHGQPQ